MHYPPPWQVRPVVSLSSAGQRVSLAASTGAEFTRRAGPGEGVAGAWQGEDLQVPPAPDTTFTSTIQQSERPNHHHLQTSIIASTTHPR